MYDDPSAVVLPGWYDDPCNRYEYRYHNGQRWTSDVSSGGHRFIDPMGVAPTPTPTGEAGAGAVRQRALPPHVAAVVPPGWSLPVAPASHPARTLSVLAMIFGLVGLLLALVPFLFVVGAGSAVTALVLGILALRRIGRADTAERSGRGRAVAGVAMAPVALGLCVVGFVFTRITLREIEDYSEPGRYEVTVDECAIDDRLVTANGTISNLDDSERSYVILVEYRNGNRVVAQHRVEVDHVAAGTVGTWSDGRLLGDVAPAELSCEPTQVTGPYPFDLSPTG